MRKMGAQRFCLIPWILPLFFLLLCEALEADDWNLTILKENDLLVMGQPFQILLEAEDDTQGIPFPFYSNLWGSDFLIMDQKKDPLLFGHSVTLLPLRSGRLKIVLEDQEWGIDVMQPGLPHDLELCEPDLLRPAPQASMSFGLWLVLVLILGLAGTLYGLYLRQRKPANTSAPIAYHMAALQRLHQLREAPLTEWEAYDAYYVELSGILRDYVSMRFGLDALKQTADETLEVLSKGGQLSKEQKKQLQTIFEQSDRVKFSQHRHGKEEALHDLEEVFDFVEAAGQAAPEGEYDVSLR